MRPVRETDGHDAIRINVDAAFELLHDELEECYYGTRGEDGVFISGTGWRDGISRPFLSISTIDLLSLNDFNTLHGLIFMVYDLIDNEERGKSTSELKTFFRSLPAYQQQWLLAIRDVLIARGFTAEVL